MIISLQTFFKEVGKHEFLFAHPVLFLVSAAPEYPVLFCSHSAAYLKKQYEGKFQIVDVADYDYVRLQALCESTFLGSQMIYWLRGSHDLDATARKRLEEYLVTYRGPNILVYVVAQPLVDLEKKTRVELPAEIGRQQFADLLVFSGIPMTAARGQAIDALFLRLPAISLDVAALLIEYVALAATSFDQFIDQWLYKVVNSEHSLFTLSQYFFARESRRFFSLYGRIQDAYAPAFWTSFWSEQVWRAYQYRKLMEAKNIRDAKLVAFRLPFSFIQRDWRSCTLKELKAAHDMINDLDIQAKNGGDAFGFDVFYTKFFTKNF